MTNDPAVRFYAYNGYPMKDEMICYSNLSTGYVTVCRGSRTSTAADGISSVIVDLAGYASVSAALFNSVQNAYEAYAEITETAPVYGSYEDFVQVKLNYDIFTKYTYADLGFGDGYRLGAVTQRIRLIDIEILRYYAEDNGSSEAVTRKALNKTFQTVSFESPAQAAAVNVYVPWVERINAEILGHPIVF